MDPEETAEARAARHAQEMEDLRKEWKLKEVLVREVVEAAAAAHLKSMQEELAAIQELLAKQTEENKEAAEALPA